MTLLKPMLEGSLLLRPWVRLAEVSRPTIASWARQSIFLRPFQALEPKPNTPTTATSPFAHLFKLLLPIGIACLFLAQSFQGTGIIGGGTVLLFLACIVGWLLLRPSVLSRLTVVDLLIGLFLGSAILSTAFSSFSHTSLIGLAKLLTFMSGYVVFRVMSEQGRKPVTMLLWVLALLGLGESLIGFYQHAMHIQPLATWNDPSINPELQMDRIFGTLKPSNPNLLAGFLIPCFAASTGLSLLYFKKKTFPISLGLLGISVLILVALVLTGSRGGFLAIGTMLICMFAYLGHLIWHEKELKQFKWMKPAWLIILLVSLLALGGGILSSEKIRTRVASIFAMREDSSISYRFNVYNSAMHMVRDNPVVGIGPGNGTFKLVYGLYMIPGYNALGSYSVPLEIAVEQGAVGLIIFLSLLLVLMLRTGLALETPSISLQRKLVVGALLTGILGSFAYGIFDTIWYRPSVNLLFWFMVASLAALTEPPTDANTFKGTL
jgi:putative inorganic carbon (HCO3(-)) transporter